MKQEWQDAVPSSNGDRMYCVEYAGPWGGRLTFTVFASSFEQAEARARMWGIEGEAAELISQLEIKEQEAEEVLRALSRMEEARRGERGDGPV